MQGIGSPGSWTASPLRQPLIDPFAAADALAATADGARGCVSATRRLGKDFLRQLSLSGPLAINLVAANAAAVINLLFVARGGTTQLAAAALGNNVAVMMGRLVLLGLCGALDTLAAQAWGAGKEARLPLLLQRTVLFLWAHCFAISGAMLALPYGLAALGQDAVLGSMVRRYLLALLPSVWLEAVSRPITRVLVARGTATPQMVVALIGLPLNVATNYALVVVAGWEYVGAAAATSAAAGLDVVLLLGYVALSGQWGGVVGTPTRRAFQGWRQLARLAYPAASMKCAESWAFTIMTLAASLLPDACTATAAVGVSYNVYGVLFIAFVACSTAACVTVGNRLGAGDAAGARSAAAASLLVVPVAWGAAAVALLLPKCQDVIIGLFVNGASASGGGSGGGSDGAPPGPIPDPGGGGGGGGGGGEGEALRVVLKHMLVIVAGLVLLDGVQTILSGVIQGCGRQRAGAAVNAVAFYVFAVPLALGLAFQGHLPGGDMSPHAAQGRAGGGGGPGGGGPGGGGWGGGWVGGGGWWWWLPERLRGAAVGLGLGPEGLYLGMAAGPVIQTICYSCILLRTNWERAAEAAVTAASMPSTTSLTGLMSAAMRRLDPGALAGSPLVRATSNNGMALSGLMPWLLPIIEERSGEGRDSNDGPLGMGRRGGGGGCCGGGGGGGGGSFEDLDLLAGLGLEGWSPVRPPTDYRGYVGGSGGGGGGGGAATAAARVASALVAAAAAPATLDVDLSPALILAHGSPPRGASTSSHRLLASTLDDSGSERTSRAAASVSAAADADADAAGSLLPMLLPNGSLRGSRLSTPAASTYITAHGDSSFGPATPSTAATAAAAAPAVPTLARSLLRALRPGTAAPASVPLAVPGSAAAAAAAAGVSSRWFQFGWGRGGAAADLPVEGTGAPIAAAAGGNGTAAAAVAPLQLPGLAAEPAKGGRSSPGSGHGGSPAVAEVIAAAVGGNGGRPGAPPPLPPMVAFIQRREVAAAVVAGEGGRSGGTSGNGSADGEYGVLAAAAAAAATATVDGRPPGELYRSCESLAAALPGSQDYYVYSPGGTPGGADGAGWLDANTPRGGGLAAGLGLSGLGGSGATAASPGSATLSRMGPGAALSLSGRLRAALFGSSAGAAATATNNNLSAAPSSPPPLPLAVSLPSADQSLGITVAAAAAAVAASAADSDVDSEYCDARTHRSSSGGSGWATPGAAGSSGAEDLA